MAEHELTMWDDSSVVVLRAVGGQSRAHIRVREEEHAVRVALQIGALLEMRVTPQRLVIRYAPKTETEEGHSEARLAV